MLLRKDSMNECWQNLPGRFLPWILLAQPSAGATEGVKWGDLMLAKEVIAPEQRGFSEALLRKYAHYGLLEKRGMRWVIAESRTVFESTAGGGCNLRFCGNPAILWSLFRYMSAKTFDLPLIEVVDTRGDRAPIMPPFMSRVCWGYGPVWTGLQTPVGSGRRGSYGAARCCSRAASAR